MEPIPLVASSSIRSLVAFRAGVGGAGRMRVPRASGVGALPLTYAGRLFEDLAQAVGDEGVGLRVGGAWRFEESPLGGHVAGSLTVGAALAGAARESARFCGGQRIWLTQRGDQVWLRRRHSDALRRGRRQANDFALQMLIDLLRRGAGPRWRPTELYLEGPPPAHTEQLAAMSAGSTRFGADADGLVFPASVLALPLPPSARCGESPAPPLPDMDFVDSVRLTIQCLLELGELSLPNVAEAAGTSARSLQRRIAASGLGFARLVDETRFRAASRLLRDSAIRIFEIAAALGYADAANFTRAFRRWAGVTPLVFRRAASQLEGSVSGPPATPAPRPSSRRR